MIAALGSRTAVLALGGGGARGLAHFGAYQAVTEADFRVERIVGVSMGGLAGALCALPESIQAVQARVCDYVTSPEFQTKQVALFGANPKTDAGTSSGLMGWYDRIRMFLWARQLLGRVVRKPSLLSCDMLSEVIADVVPDIDISETVTPLSIVAVDLRSGHPVVLERGPLRKAVAASASIPGIFPPVEWDDFLLCDIGVLDSLPSDVARAYASQYVIGVDVGPSLERADGCESALHVLLRIDEIGERLYRRHSRKAVDLLIRPQVGHREWFDFAQPERLVTAGLAAGRQAIAEWQRGVGSAATSAAGRIDPAQRLV